MKCSVVKDCGESCKSIRLDAVYDPDPNGTNASWSKWTPSGSVQMTITNPQAFDQFEEGQEYMVTFNKV